MQRFEMGSRCLLQLPSLWPDRRFSALRAAKRQLHVARLLQAEASFGGLLQHPIHERSCSPKRALAAGVQGTDSKSWEKASCGEAAGQRSIQAASGQPEDAGAPPAWPPDHGGVRSRKAQLQQIGFHHRFQGDGSSPSPAASVSEAPARRHSPWSQQLPGRRGSLGIKAPVRRPDFAG